MPASPFINYNGQILPEGEKIFTSSNRAFRYGDGLFESIRMVQGEVKFANLHAERLRKGMEFLRLENNGKMTGDFLRETILDLSRRSKVFGDARIRFSVFRSGEGFYTPQDNTFSYLVEVAKLDTKGYELNKKGLSIGVFTEVQKYPDSLANFKTCNALPFILAGVYKIEKQLDEVILLNTSGNLVEATSSNVFVVKNGDLFTPALNEGCIAGVMRNVILHLATENGIRIKEDQLKPTALNTAEEVFFTNATSGIRWAVGYGQKRYFNKVSKGIWESLNKL